ncbi:MAG: permease-like cell division protein FtsX [Firmicutes bacterium]|nr:permease-like cell division protein FtsX [Bacillota bacterium]
MLGYFVKEGIRNIYLNGFMSVASVLVMVCCLVLTGISFLISENVKTAIRFIEGNNSITVYIKEDSFVDVDKIGEQIKSIPNVLSCKFYSKEEAMKEYKNLIGDSLNLFCEGEENPLPDAFHVSMSDLSFYDCTIDKITKIESVDSVSDRSEVAKKLSDIKRLCINIGSWIVFGLSMVSIMIISNTIRITIHNRRFEINIMKSIGATNMFIKIPFIVEGVIIGLISSSISIFILKLIYNQIIDLINGIMLFSTISFNEMFGKIFLIFLVSGITIGVIAGLISIKRYLNKEGGISVAW